jgi:hypothetical protein
LINPLEDFDPFHWTLDQIVQWIDPMDGHSAVERLFNALQSGHISATGRRILSRGGLDDLLVARPQPELGEREEIRTILWADLKISPYENDSLCVLEMRGGHWRPAWRDVLVRREQVLTLWVPRGPRGFERPVSSDRTGLAGRPSSKNLYEQKLAERIEAGQLSQSLEEEAKFLRGWLQETYPAAPPGGLSALKNNIRHLYKKGKAQTA